jgi:hypothetical protein
MAKMGQSIMNNLMKILSNMTAQFYFPTDFHNTYKYQKDKINHDGPDGHIAEYQQCAKGEREISCMRVPYQNITCGKCDHSKMTEINDLLGHA